MKLVRFEDGTFGVRRWWFFGWVYLDLKSPSMFNWSAQSEYFIDCKGTKEQALKAMKRKSRDSHVVVRGED